MNQNIRESGTDRELNLENHLLLSKLHFKINISHRKIFILKFTFLSHCALQLIFILNKRKIVKNQNVAYKNGKGFCYFSCMTLKNSKKRRNQQFSKKKLYFLQI